MRCTQSVVDIARRRGSVLQSISCHIILFVSFLLRLVLSHDENTVATNRDCFVAVTGFAGYALCSARTASCTCCYCKFVARYRFTCEFFGSCGHFSRLSSVSFPCAGRSVFETHKARILLGLMLPAGKGKMFGRQYWPRLKRFVAEGVFRIHPRVSSERGA